MNNTEKAKIFQSSLNFIIFVILGVICYYYLIEDAIKKSEKGAKTITSTEGQKNLQKYKNTLRNNKITNKFRNFWRHDNVS